VLVDDQERVDLHLLSKGLVGGAGCGGPKRLGGGGAADALGLCAGAGSAGTRRHPRDALSHVRSHGDHPKRLRRLLVGYPPVEEKSMHSGEKVKRLKEFSAPRKLLPSKITMSSFTVLLVIKKYLVKVLKKKK
jgi:hypothetical protein